ncbi:pachytene checkpoint component Pch2 [Pseudovirgaria hyperparasitica]|uniref:Pachytene checkpoint component Pch2 n=1 Tax=Pseudovirgaria hyperparasitica TaxID=470096 RepID=A0A6A6WCM7_9PEZI|nr:pachytene checkpoint component Pch2 [Pseudovirgaria hyperparasitica]KAF2759327.1 pachytene checkpoint component Pch2 [Pseudovirgaria hyperparasitica]
MSTNETSFKPALHVECRMRDTDGFVRPDRVREEVTEWICENFISLRIDQRLENYEELNHGGAIQSISVVGFSGVQEDSLFHRLADVQLDVQAYMLHPYVVDDHVSEVRPGQQHDDELKPKTRTMPLPSANIHGLWESFTTRMGIVIYWLNCIRELTSKVSMTKSQRLDPNIVSWNHLVLLYGPPGTGKSSLSRALAHKLTIRLGKYFLRGKLVEVDPQSLFSRYFGESGQLVAQIFEQINAMADDEACLICVVIDEVETLTSPRERAATGNECGDALRATNQLLTCIDALRHRPNIVLFCTSNMLQAIDSAFVDRIDIKQLVPNPCPRAIYEIFRTCINELLRTGVLVPSKSNNEDPNLNMRPESPLSQSVHDFVLIEPISIPRFAEMEIRLYDQPHAPARKLWIISQKADGLSGRTLRKLPFLALALYTFTEPSTIHEGLYALSLAVEHELRAYNPHDTDLSD